MNIHQIVDKLQEAENIGLALKLPKIVTKCPLCGGKGEYSQRYTSGCGGGYYRSPGPCDVCKHPDLFMRGSGYVYRGTTGSIPNSVINQIYEKNKDIIEVMHKIRESE